MFFVQNKLFFSPDMECMYNVHMHVYIVHICTHRCHSLSDSVEERGRGLFSFAKVQQTCFEAVAKFVEHSRKLIKYQIRSMIKRSEEKKPDIISIHCHLPINATRIKSFRKNTDVRFFISLALLLLLSNSTQVYTPYQ